MRDPKQRADRRPTPSPLAPTKGTSHDFGLGGSSTLSHSQFRPGLGRGIIAFLSAIAKDERPRILKRCSEGRHCQGIRTGCNPKLTEYTALS